jgi:hypothetical protein
LTPPNTDKELFSDGASSFLGHVPTPPNSDPSAGPNGCGDSKCMQQHAWTQSPGDFIFVVLLILQKNKPRMHGPGPGSNNHDTKINLAQLHAFVFLIMWNTNKITSIDPLNGLITLLLQIHRSVDPWRTMGDLACRTLPDAK